MNFDNEINLLKQQPIMNGWEVTRTLGHGRYGIVYEIRRYAFNQLEEFSALKWIRIHPSPAELMEGENRTGIKGDKLLKERYMSKKDDCIKEIQLMYQLRGESTIVSYDSSDAFLHTDGVGWNILIRMERLIPLKDHLCTKPITLNTILNIGSSIAEALSVCHSKGIIHGDVKIENCYHFRDNVYKLGDFGLSVTQEYNEKNIAGTSGYLSPECSAGEAKTAFSDQYALGIMLSTLLQGKLSPTTANTHSKPGHCPRELWHIIERAIQTNPNDRFPSMLAMKRELDEIRVKAFHSDFLFFQNAETSAEKDHSQPQATASNVLQNTVVAAYDAAELAGIKAISKGDVKPTTVLQTQEIENVTQNLQHTQEKEEKEQRNKRIRLIIAICSCAVILLVVIAGFFQHKSSQKIDGITISRKAESYRLSWEGGNAPYTVQVIYDNKLIDVIEKISKNYCELLLCPGETYIARITDQNGTVCAASLNIEESKAFGSSSFHIDSAYVYNYTIRNGETMDKAKDKTAVDGIVIRSQDLQADGKGFYLRIGYRASKEMNLHYYLLCGNIIESNSLRLAQTPADTTYYFTVPLTDKLASASNNDVLKFKIYSDANELLHQVAFTIQRN